MQKKLYIRKSIFIIWSYVIHTCNSLKHTTGNGSTRWGSQMQILNFQWTTSMCNTSDSFPLLTGVSRNPPPANYISFKLLDCGCSCGHSNCRHCNCCNANGNNLLWLKSGFQNWCMQSIAAYCGRNPIPMWMHHYFLVVFFVIWNHIGTVKWCNCDNGRNCNMATHQSFFLRASRKLSDHLIYFLNSKDI